ncbi:DUF1129 family protein [Staphylococcus massiliensis]|uniref:DUF1129 family protein n=1 Tax=Staphylococcus massiliensis TaxID=555791 RepID=UPI00370D33E4
MNKSTEELARENNVKLLRLNNTDRDIYENYMTYIRSDLRVNQHDSEVLLSDMLDHLLEAENKGMHAMEFFEHDPKKHAKKTIRSLPNETFQNIVRYICNHFLLLLGVFFFLEGFTGFFIGVKRLYLFTFPLLFIFGLIMVFLFIWAFFRSIQLQSFERSRFTSLWTYASLIILGILTFQVFFIPQTYLYFGPYVKIGNWTFIILSAITLAIAIFIEQKRENASKS